jgi:hypothetical protein
VPLARRIRSGIDVALVGILAGALVPLFLRPVSERGFPFPVGPDLPVYLWWARAGVAEGLSVVGERPGMPALIPTIGGALNVGTVPAIAGLQYALGPAIGLAASSLVRGRGRRGVNGRAVWWVGGLLAGVWAVHLAAGYLSNMAFVAPYLAAAAALSRRTRRGAIGAAVALTGAGLAHPQFFLVGALILTVTAGWAALLDGHVSWRTDAGRTATALVGSAVAVGGGLLSMLIGPERIGGETSKDGFLRRSGAWSTLRDTYLLRFARNQDRYAAIVAVPAASVGAIGWRHGYAGRFLLAWLGFTAVALPIGVLTGWYPPDRVLTFAFCIPILAALGLAEVGRRLGRWWWLAWPIGAVVAGMMIVPAIRSWDAQLTYMSPDELRDATLAARVASTTPPGTQLVFVVDDPMTSALFLQSHALNVARATVPAERVDDVHIYVGSPSNLLAGQPTLRGDPLYDMASARSLDDVAADREMAVFVVREFDRVPGALEEPGLVRWDPGLASTVPNPRPLQPVVDELSPVAPSELTGATVRTLVFLVIIGFGWAWWALGDVAGGAASAAAFGVATLTMTAIALERLGVAIETGTGASFASALAGGSGYAVLLWRRLRQHNERRRVVVERQPQRKPPVEVPERSQEQQ